MGFLNQVHHPEVLTSTSGRMEVTSSPKVGMVQSRAMTKAAADAPGEVSFCFATAAADGSARPGLPPVGPVSVGGGGRGSHRASSLRIWTML